MEKCDIHKGVDAAPNGSFFGKKYCAKCVEQIKKAQQEVRRHVTPRDCLIWYEDAKTGWAAIKGTGCGYIRCSHRSSRRSSPNRAMDFGRGETPIKRSRQRKAM